MRATILLAALALAPAAQAATLVGLTADNHLVRIDPETRRAMPPVKVRGAEGKLLGIDIRPLDGRLYGLTDVNQIVVIDPATGRATEVSRLSEPFVSGGRATVDFNPVADRLRVIGMNGWNYRINVETGAVAKDGQLKYQAGGPLAETMPRVVAGAYTNSTPGAQQTQLFTIDTASRTLNLQAPPNDGVQQPKAQLALDLPPGVAFDILADGQGGNAAWLLAGGTLHRIDVLTGRVTVEGAVAALPKGEIIDIAAMK